jgi:hypothetical protein
MFLEAGKKDESKTKTVNAFLQGNFFTTPENLYFSLMNVVDAVFLEDLSIE